MRRMVLLSLFLAAACIERPQGSRAYGPEVNRAGLQGVLLSGNPSPSHYVGAQFDSGIELIGYDVSPEPVPRGAVANITVYYAATEDVKDDWEIFVHLEDPGRALQRIIRDHYPAEGRFRTYGWRRGDIIKDTFSVMMPDGANGLEFWTGFFQDNDRLPVVSNGRAVNDGANRLRLGLIAYK